MLKSVDGILVRRFATVLVVAAGGLDTADLVHSTSQGVEVVTRCILSNAGLERRFWVEAVNIACFCWKPRGGVNRFYKILRQINN